MKKDDFGNRMKLYEKLSTNYKLTPNLPVIARIDGKAFHSFCKHFNKPFDEDLMSAMIYTTKCLVKNTNALIGYTQSDEITLIWNNAYQSPMIFEGKLHKLNSVLASMATATFNDEIRKYKDVKQPALFDCRVWNVPTRIEACNVLLWREQDAVRNSIQMLGQASFTHKQLHKKNCHNIQDMLHEVGINWNDLSSGKKRGTYVRRIIEQRQLALKEIDRLPMKHDARSNPALKFSRSKIVELKVPIFSTILNKVEFVFDKAHPIILK